MGEDTDALSNILSNLDIGDSSTQTIEPGTKEIDTLENFKKQFIDFLSNNPQIVTNSQLIPDNEKALIILSPLSVKHSFGRSWVSKSYISTIVERPQRLLACSLGIAAALSMYPSNYSLVSSNKRSPLTSPHVLKIHGKNWPADLKKICEESEAKLAKGEVEVPSDWNSGDIYLTKGTLDAVAGVIGSVETAVDSILKQDNKSAKRAFVAIRPPGHHSHPCVPSGFCLLNNAQIAIEYAAAKHGVTHAVILDIDLHHGDGTQDICWQKAGFEPDFGEQAAGYTEEGQEDNDGAKKEANDPKVGYFSLHDINSFPTELGYATAGNIKNASTCLMAHDLAIWNVHLQPYQTEEDFYVAYQERYTQLLKKADEYLSRAKIDYERTQAKLYGKKPFPPFKSIVVISAGFDASEYEVHTMQRHGVHVPTSFYSKFTSDAVKLANKHSNGVLLSLLEGGYSDGALTSGVFSHLIGLQSQKWEHAWGSSDVVKELVKGCKPKWTPLKAPNTEIKQWANQVCKLGRAMLPEAIIQSPTQSSKSTPDNKENIMATSRVTRSHSKLPADKMVPDKFAVPIDDHDVTTPRVIKTGPLEESTPTPLPKQEAASNGEFKHRFVKVDGEWRPSPSRVEIS